MYPLLVSSDVYLFIMHYTFLEALSLTSSRPRLFQEAKDIKSPSSVSKQRPVLDDNITGNTALTPTLITYKCHFTSISHRATTHVQLKQDENYFVTFYILRTVT